jgi:hypothetical protein
VLRFQELLIAQIKVFGQQALVAIGWQIFAIKVLNLLDFGFIDFDHIK